MGEGEPLRVRIIKRYSNRKLYSISDSRYVTLKELASILRDGSDVKVLDAKTGADITSVVLAQLLYEEEKKRSPLLPISLVKTLFREKKESLREMLKKLSTPEALPFAPAREEIEAHMENLIKKGELSVRDGKKIISQALLFSQRWIDEVIRRVDERVKEIHDYARTIVTLHARVEDLARRVEKLEQEMRNSRRKEEKR